MHSIIYRHAASSFISIPYTMILILNIFVSIRVYLAFLSVVLLSYSLLLCCILRFSLAGVESCFKALESFRILF